MNSNIPSSVEYLGEKPNLFTEVLNTERKLLALIYSKGVLNNEVHELYQKACSDYENIILNDLEMIKLQEVEYFLWKLHYMQIEEFRKRINLDRHVEGFRSFLSEATEFYENLIKKFRRNYGLPGDLILSGKTDPSFLVEPVKFSRTQYACHRFLICLGDIARYREICKKPDCCNWSLAASYYLEAARISPDSGNPHNQLALLATYVGDSFLALYHCLRSLAVKEPFPDAQKNLMLLIEENRSSQLSLLSSDAQIDFSRPYERIFLETTSNGSNHPLNNNESEATENISSSKTDLWTLFIRMISFFLVRTNMEDFPFSLASTMRELEALVAVDGEELQGALESYQRIDSSRRGPHRAIQLVSIFIFIIHSLTEKDEKQQSPLAESALATTFLSIGRFIERCIETKNPKICPFLPCVLKFVEWLVINLDKVEEYAADEKVTSTMSYFFDVLAHLLNRLDHREGEVSRDNISLWEDHELRGFEPMAGTHVGLDFTMDKECLNNVDCRNVNRSSRIFNAAMRIVQRSNKPRKWILYDKVGRKFYKPEFMKELQEEEEVILFMPLIRHNSAPLYSEESIKGKEVRSDESVRRVTSLNIRKNQTQNDTFNFHSDANFRGNKPLKHQEPPLLKDSTTCAVGPPSLSGWVLNQEIPKIDREKGIRNSGKFELSPIDELSPASLIDLSINENKDSEITYENKDSEIAYAAPAPSAPLLPDDAIWFTGNSPSSRLFHRPMVSNDNDGILGASPISGYSNFVPRISGIFDGYPPFLGMSSSEWLYHYRNNHNLEQHRHHTFPVHLNTNDVSSFGVFDQRGNYLVSEHPMVYLDSSQLLPTPLVYNADAQIGERLLPGHQRSPPYAYRTVSDLRAEQPPLLQYLKEREWQMQREAHLEGSTFIRK